MTLPDPEVLRRVRGAATVVTALGSAIEDARRLPPEAVDALTRAGVFKLAVARELGGGNVDAATLLSAIEEVARADGSAGWCVMIGATSGLMSAYLDDDTAREIYGPANAITCGVFAPTGRAVPEGDGFRVRGRWSFASGCEHSAFRMVGTITTVEPPETLPSGAPDVRSVLLRAEDTEVIDTWTTGGLRGTGSHDLAVKDVWVPRSRTFSLLTTPPRGALPIHRLPFFGLLASGVASVALGIARSAIDAFVELAIKKTPLGGKGGIAHRELVQVAVARAEAKVRGARALLHETIADAEAEAAARGEASLRARALVRLAAASATTESAAAVDLVYEAAGGTPIYAASRLGRCFRDVHVATQHVMVGPTSTTLAGRILLGLDSDTSTL
jgi:alkylation response protein AidB-like acyl-CoA dehydrogenase